MARPLRSTRPAGGSSTSIRDRAVEAGSTGACLGRARFSGSLPLPIAPVVNSPPLPIVGVVSLSLPVAAVLGSLLVSVRLLPAAVVVGQVLRVLLLPALHARLAVWSAAVLPRAVAAELRSRLLLPALRAALQVDRGGHEEPRYAPEIIRVSSVQPWASSQALRTATASSRPCALQTATRA
jgi:hypothetical protein